MLKIVNGSHFFVWLVIQILYWASSCSAILPPIPKGTATMVLNHSSKGAKQYLCLRR